MSAAAQEIVPGLGVLKECGTASQPIVPAGMFAMGGVYNDRSVGAGGYPAWIHGATTFPT